MKHIFATIYVFIGVAIVTFMSCSHADGSHISVREAQVVVAQADSLWHAGKMYGVDEGDSATLAKAYERLKEHSAFSCQRSEFAHACYHYGKLLRAKDDPVASMQAFINATHSHTRDYHILGRVYSNMGDICHLAGEYQLSYDMFEKSADMFLRNGDTLNYYYGLNDMAYELAEQGKKETLTLFDTIVHNCGDKIIIAKAWETKAEFFIRTAQYDSAVWCVNFLNSIGVNESTGMLIKAQAYDDMGQKDSALIYSNIILSNSYASYQDRFNALYIVLHCDSALDAKDINSLASQREDIRYYEFEPQREKLSIAIGLLQQDLNRQPDYRWIYVMVAAILMAGSFYYWIYWLSKKQMNKHIEQLIERQSDSIVQSIKQHIDANDLNHTLHWKDYASMKVDADLYMGGIVSKLESKNLNETEIRFCLLTMLDFSQYKIAETIHYSYPSGIKTLKRRISVKLGTIPPKLHDYLFQMAINV